MWMQNANILSDASVSKAKSHVVIWSPFDCPTPGFTVISGFMWFCGDSTERGTRGDPDWTLGFFPDFLRHWSRLSLASILVPKTCRWCFSSDLALRNNAGWDRLRRRRCLRTKTYQRWQGAWRKWDRQGQARYHRTWLRATARVEVKPEMRNKDKSFWVSCFHIHS